MTTALAPYRGAPSPTVAERVRASLSEFWSRLTRAQATTWGSAGWSIVRGQQPADFQGVGSEVRKLGWERHPVVNACGRVIVELIQSVPLEVYKQRADGTAIVQQSSPALDILRAPRTGISGRV